MKKRIYYHDTDCGGVVYYANYLKYIEEARTDFFEQRGISIRDSALSGTMFVVARQEIDYKSPAVYGDILDVSVKIAEMKAVKLVFDHEIKNQDGRLICLARTVMVCVGSDIRPKAIPDEIRQRLE